MLASPPRLVSLAVLLGLAACRGGEDASLAREPEPSMERSAAGWYGTEVPEPRPTPTIRLVDADHRPFDLASERGKVVLVFLGYTQCPDICPTTLAQWVRVKRALGADSARVRFVFISVDPERDTPEDAERYAQKFDPSFVGLTGRRSEVDMVQRQFRVSSFAEAPPAAEGGSASAREGHEGHGAADSATRPLAGYTVAHASRVFVIDREGRW
ncbi:MAG TPA: SCO family protein, partial [Gemmatimonadaceae bacterium]|nr:SCO family protein [Gemmatimonadaceae bacterium]